MEKRFVDDVKLAAKRFCHYAMEYTLPKSTAANPWPVHKLQDRIEIDIMRAYPTYSDEMWATSAYDLIAQHYTEEKAKDWWHEYRNKTQSNFDPENPSKIDAEETFNKMRKIPRRIKDGQYQDLRRKNGYARLPAKTKPLAFVNDSSRKAYIKKRQRSAGLAKSGWYCAARTVGGTMNYTRAKNEAGRFVWPPEIRRVIGPFGGISSLGASSIHVAGLVGRFSVTNKVRHASDAMPDHLLDIAVRRARDAMRILFEQRAKGAMKEKGAMAA